MICRYPLAVVLCVLGCSFLAFGAVQQNISIGRNENENLLQCLPVRLSTSLKQSFMAIQSQDKLPSFVKRFLGNLRANISPATKAFARAVDSLNIRFSAATSSITDEMYAILDSDDEFNAEEARMCYIVTQRYYLSMKAWSAANCTEE